MAISPLNVASKVPSTPTKGALTTAGLLQGIEEREEMAGEEEVSNREESKLLAQMKRCPSPKNQGVDREGSC